MINLAEYIVMGTLSCWFGIPGEYQVVLDIEPRKTKGVYAQMLYSPVYRSKVEINGFDMTSKTNLCIKVK